MRYYRGVSYGPGVGCLGCLGWLMAVAIAGGLVVMAVAWPLYVHGWPLALRVFVEVLWVAVLLGLIILTAVARHRAETPPPQPTGRHQAGSRHGRPGPPDQPTRIEPTARPAPRDWSPPQPWPEWLLKE